MVLGKGSVFSYWPLPFEEDGTDGCVVVEDVDTDVPEQKNIGLLAIHSDLGVETQSSTYVDRIEVVVQNGIEQHEGLPRFVFHG